MFKLSENQMYNYTLYTVIFIIFIVIIWYVYTYFIVPKFNPTYVNNNEFHTGADKISDVTVMIFHANWCPHCQSAMKSDGPWTLFKQNYENATINNTKIYIEEVDCSDENGDAISKRDEYNIEGYPSIILIKNGQVFDYDAKPNQRNLEEFIDTHTRDNK
jgi:thiol-disulfide isomerase/thioredoxin